MIKYNIDYKFSYWGPLLMEVEMKDEVISLLLKKGGESKKEHLDARKKLAGEIDNEYYFENIDEWFCPILNPYINSYIEAVSDYKDKAFKSPIKEWNLDKLWINYQKALEYNPPHNHDGDLSFIIFLQVPEEIVKENEETKDEHNNAGPGMICFDFGQEMSFSISRMSVMPEVGQAFIFPAWLVHHVYAFKSNVERISVAGNISFKYDREIE